MPSPPSGRSPWIVRRNPAPHASIHLYVIPHAGGSAASFSQWVDELPSDVELRAVQLPGREERLAESPYDEMEPLVDELAGVVADHVDRKYALFGHSMGAKVAFELTRQLQTSGAGAPEHLFLSGSAAPHMNRTPSSPPLHTLPDEEFIERLRDYGGAPEAVLERKGLIDLLLPGLRADFKLGQTYTYDGPSLTDKAPLACPVTAFGGTQTQSIDRSDFQAWEDVTTGPFSLQMIDGDHFFPYTHPRTVVRRILDALSIQAGGARS